jgi:hypothetical protein
MRISSQAINLSLLLFLIPKAINQYCFQIRLCIHPWKQLKTWEQILRLSRSLISFTDNVYILEYILLTCIYEGFMSSLKLIWLLYCTSKTLLWDSIEVIKFTAWNCIESSSSYETKTKISTDTPPTGSRLTLTRFFFFFLHLKMDPVVRERKRKVNTRASNNFSHVQSYNLVQLAYHRGSGARTAARCWQCASGTYEYQATTAERRRP